MNSMNTPFFMDNIAIKEGALSFMVALNAWKSAWWTMSSFLELNISCTEDEILITKNYYERLINPIIEAFDPVLKICMVEGFDAPFDLGGYMVSNVGRTLGDELAYPEITEPYSRIKRLLMGGMTHQEFWVTKYYKEGLLPKNWPK